MILNRIFSTYTFRFAFFYVVAISIIVFVLLGLLYASFSYDYFNEVHESITAELEHLDETYRREGVAGVQLYVDEVNTPGKFNKFYYLLVDENFNTLAGNLKRWPKFRTYREGWLSFELGILKVSEGLKDDFVGRSRDLPNGYHLLTARHYNDVLERIKLVAGTLIQSMLVTIILGMIGAAWISADMLRRVDVMNKTIQTIMAGDLSERIPLTKPSGDFHRLALNLNQMLSRIEALMAGVRQVSDNIAHDLRTPLSRLRNGLTQLEYNSTAQSDEDRQKIVQNLIDEADDLLSTFNALLRIAQIESGNRRSGFGELNIKMLMEDVVELYEPLAIDKDLHFSCLIEEDIVLTGDRDLLFQMVANLVDNAIKYTPPGGNIQVRLEKKEAEALIEIADSGIGINLADQERVFKRFFRVEASRGQQPGNGLGLSLVNAVVNLHYGKIKLSDNHPGLNVKVSLPA